MIDTTRSSRQSTSRPKTPERPDAGHSAEKKGENGIEDDSFIHYRCSTLAHFIALLCRPVASTLPSNTAVVVIDSLSALLNESFPKATDGQKEFRAKKGIFPRRIDEHVESPTLVSCHHRCNGDGVTLTLFQDPAYRPEGSKPCNT